MAPFFDRIRERCYRLIRRVRPFRERVTIGERNDLTEREHLARYHFVKRFCEGKTVADIACGTGYGMKILSETAASVEGYDKEPLCGNILIDLEKERWLKRYDVIVSLETIEHLANPEWLLENIQKTAGLIFVSTPIGEFRGYNEHHKQVWELAEFQELVERYFQCRYYYQVGEAISELPVKPVRFLIAVGTPRENG